MSLIQFYTSILHGTGAELTNEMDNSIITHSRAQFRLCSNDNSAILLNKPAAAKILQRKGFAVIWEFSLGITSAAPQKSVLHAINHRSSEEIARLCNTSRPQTGRYTPQDTFNHYQRIIFLIPTTDWETSRRETMNPMMLPKSRNNNP